MEPDEYRGVRVLVTGAGGFLGSHLTRALVVAGAQVHALSSRPHPVPRLPCPELIWHRADLRDAAALAAAVADASPRVVFHLAAYGTTHLQRDPGQAVQVNVEGALHLAQSLPAVTRRVVLAGTCAEYGAVNGPSRESMACLPIGIYPASKLAGFALLAALLRSQERELVELRLYGPFGPADDPRRLIPQVIDRLLAGTTVDVTPGDQVRDYGYVEDHVRAFLAAGSRPLSAPIQVLNIGRGVALRVRDLLLQLAEAVGGDAVERLRIGALSCRPDESPEMWCSPEAARAELGFTPRVPLDVGLRRTVAWHRERQEATGA